MNNTTNNTITLNVSDLPNALSGMWASLENTVNNEFGIDIRDLATKIHGHTMALFTVTIGFVLYMSNSTFFVIGFIFSVINKDLVDNAQMRIRAVWSRYNNKPREVPYKAVIVIAVVIAWPITMPAGSFFMGAELGSFLQKPIEEMLEEV